MLKKITFILLAASCLILFSCFSSESGSNDTDSSTSSTTETTEPTDTSGSSTSADTSDSTSNILAKIDITNATNLFVASANTGTRSDNVKKLFKITNEGYIKAVTYFDQDGKKYTTTSVPSNIYNVNSEYIILTYSTDNTSYIVRKTDGAIYSLSGIASPKKQTNTYINAPTIMTDSDNNIYFLSGNLSTNIVRIDISDPENITKTNFTSSPEGNIHNFTINDNGHGVYAYTTESNFQTQYRIKKSNGGLYNLPSNILYWIGSNGQIKYKTNMDIKIYTINIDPSSFEVTTDFITPSNPTVYISNSFNSYLLNFQNKTLKIDLDNNKITELINTADDPRSFVVAEISKIRQVAYTSDYYYLSGVDATNNSVLLRVDPSDDSVITLLSGGEYDIYKMTVSTDNIVTFNGLRMSDAAKIIATVDDSGTVTVLDESLDTEVTVLERIN